MRSFPWREPDATPYEILIAEIFLKQTRAPTVGRIHREFITQFPTPGALRGADREEIISVIRPLGLYNYRADALLEIADELEQRELPRTTEGLMELPQVGPYMANAVLCFAYGQERPIVDTNVERIYQRLLGLEMDALSEDALWELAGRMLPAGRAAEYNLALLDFGSAICTAPEPKCSECFAREYCCYYQGLIE